MTIIRKKRLMIIGGLLLIFLLFISFIMYLTAESYDDSCAFEKFPDFKRARNRVQWKDLIKADSNLEKTFPYEKYAAADNWKKINWIRDDLTIMDSINSDPHANIRVMSIALTTRLNAWQTADFDSLNLLFRWAEQFGTAAVLDEKNSILHKAVHNYWVSFVAQKLDSLNQSDYSIQYHCKFHYLRMKCCQSVNACGDRNGNMTKAVLKFIEHDWFYLSNRFWIGTTVLFKILFAAFLLVTGYAYACLVQKHFKIKMK